MQTTMLDNPMTFGDYYASPDAEVSCPRCGKQWERWGDIWESTEAATSTHYPVGNGMCRSCAWNDMSEEKLLAYVKANDLGRAVWKYMLVKRAGDADNAWIWAEIAPTLMAHHSELTATGAAEYITENQLVSDYVDFVMGV